MKYAAYGCMDGGIGPRLPGHGSFLGHVFYAVMTIGWERKDHYVNLGL